MSFQLIHLGKRSGSLSNLGRSGPRDLSAPGQVVTAAQLLFMSSGRMSSTAAFFLSDIPSPQIALRPDYR
jgi:hypothetical protein